MIASNDPSARFVLPDGAPWLKNLAALWTIDPALARGIEALEGQISYPVQAARDGALTVAVPIDHRTIYLHSRYEPLAESRQLIEAVDCGKTMAFYVFGFGLGHHVRAIFERASSEALLLVFEPDLLLLRTALESLDFSELIQSRRLLLITQADKAQLMARLTPQAALISLGARQVVHPPSQQRAGAFHDQMRQWIDEFAAFSRTSMNTLVLNSRRTAENVARNIAWYASTPSVGRLHDRYRGKPAIIVSAGPSLRKNKHLLPGLADKAVLIAVQTTLRPLLELGVEPRFVTSLDYHEISTQFYENLPAKLSAELVAEPKASGGILSMYPGPVSVLGNPFCEGLLRELRLGKTQLPGGATVAHLAFYLAEHLGCDPIIFVGQDLGFGQGLCYTPGTSHEDVWRPELSRFCTMEMKQWDMIVRDRFILRRIPDHAGRPMYTEERLFAYLQQFEKDFAASRATVIDATEGGAAKRGTIVMSLADAAEKYCTRLVEPDAHGDHPGRDERRLAECRQSLVLRREEACEIERIALATLPLLEEIRDHIASQSRVNRAIAALDVLRGKMNDLGRTYDLVTHLCQPTELKRFEADRKIAAAADSTPEQKQRAQVERDIENVRGITDAAIEFQKLMDEVIDRLPEQAPATARSVAA